MKIKYVLLAVVVSSFMACQKEPDPNILTGGPTNACKVDKSYFYDGLGGISDTAAYVYTAGQVSRVNYVNYFTTLDYTNNKVSKRSFHDYNAPDSIYFFDQFLYNGDGSINTEQDYINVAGVGSFVYMTYNYTYSGGKLNQLLIKQDTLGNGVLLSSVQTNFTYSGNNISRVILKDLFLGVSDTLDYNYDAKTNFYSKNPTLFFTDDLFLGTSGEALPFILSANNVTSVSLAGQSSNITYLVDGKQNLTELDLNGATSASYTYKCQ